VFTQSRSRRALQLALPLAIAVTAGNSALAAPPPVIPGSSPLQQTVFNAVFTMCTQFLDGHADTFTAVPQLDLHDQCHAVAVSALNSGNGGAPGAAALGALQQVSGNQVTAQGSLASRVSAGQFANISGRIDALRFGSSSAITQGSLAMNGSEATGPQSFYLDSRRLDSDSSAPPAASFINARYLDDNSIRLVSDGAPSGGGSMSAPKASSPWGLFVQGSYNAGHHDVTAAEDPFDFHSSSITAGIDYNFGSAVLGASLGYDDYDAGFRNSGANVSGGSARVEGTSASIYGAWFSEHWTFNGIASYGRLKTDLARQVTYNVNFAPGVDAQPDINDSCSATNCTVSVNRTLHGDPSGSSTAIGATAGYQYSALSFDFLPSVSVAYRRASIDAFAERDEADPTDGLPLAFNDQNVDSLRSVVSMDVSRAVSAPFGVITPLVRVEWDHEFHTGPRSITAHYVFDPSLTQGVCASCFNLAADEPPSNYGVAGVGLSATLAHRLQAYVYDEILFGYADYHSNTVSVGLRGQL
jgi:Autotransporter beta-domain